MKTKLPLGINTAEQAMRFISALFNNNEHFNFEDDANTVFKEVNGKDSKIFTIREAKRVNELIGDCYAVKDFDPEKYLVELMEQSKPKKNFMFEIVSLNESSSFSPVFSSPITEDEAKRLISYYMETINPQPQTVNQN